MARTAGSSALVTRQRILAAATTVFAEQGFSGARMLDVAERLGISKSALYYHFASKEDLLEGLVEPIMRGLLEFADGAESDTVPVEAIVRGYLDQLINFAPVLYPVLSDPAAQEAAGERNNLGAMMNRLEQALAARLSVPDAQLRAEFTLGAFRSIVLGRVKAGAAVPDAYEREALVSLALGILRADLPRHV